MINATESNIFRLKVLCMHIEHKEMIADSSSVLQVVFQCREERLVDKTCLLLILTSILGALMLCPKPAKSHRTDLVRRAVCSFFS